MGDVLQCLTPLQPAADRPVSSTRPVNVSRVTPDECRVINRFGNSANGRSLGALAQRRSCPPPADPLESKARNRFHAWMSRPEQDESTATSRRRTRYVRAGRWPVEGMYPLTCQVSNKRGAGDIIGLGRVARSRCG